MTIADSYLSPQMERDSWEETYIKNNLWEGDLDNCNQIPDELDVFSNIRQNNCLSTFSEIPFEGESAKQDNVQEYVLEKLATKYKKIIAENSTRLENGTTFPKFERTTDEEGTVVLNLTTANYNFFIALEKKIDNSFYGLFFKENNSYSSKTNLLTIDNLTEVVQNLTQLLLKYA